MTTALLGVLVALLGLLAGTALFQVIARQLETKPSGDWSTFVPVGGAVRERAWLRLAVELLTALMAFVVWYRYDLEWRSLYLFVASLVLIDTGAVDFKIRMIDTLVLVVATVLALAFAPLNAMTWLNSVLGLVVATVIFLFFFLLAKILFPGHAAPFGLGDVYLAAFIGTLSGLVGLSQALFYGIALAGLVAFGLIVVRATGKAVPTYIAYGTYLCLGTLLYIAVAT